MDLNDFLTGNQQIDEDHREIVKKINEFEETPISKDSITNFATSFIDYCSLHFSREEALMNFVGYPDTATLKHRIAHERVQNLLFLQIKSIHRYSKEEIIANFVEELMEHFQKFDVPLAKFIKETQ